LGIKPKQTWKRGRYPLIVRNTNDDQSNTLVMQVQTATAKFA
jgi:hypothetical protein